MRIIIDIDGLTATATTEINGREIKWGCTKTGYGEWTWDIGKQLEEYKDYLYGYQSDALDDINLPNLQEAFGDEFYEDEEEDEQEYYDAVNDTVYTKENMNE